PERRKGSDGGRRRGRGWNASSLPNGDTDPTARASPRAAPPTVSAPPPGATRSNGHAAHQRTAGHLDPRPGALYSEKAVVVAPGPKYREEVFAPGRQGLRVQRDSNPVCGSADLRLGPRTTAFRAVRHPVPYRCLAAQQRGPLSTGSATRNA